MSTGAATVQPTIRPLAESGLLVELGEGIDPALVERVAALTAAIEAAAIPGLVEVVPSYRTILLAFDPAATDGAAVAAAVRRLAAEAAATPIEPGREVELPVVYGGEAGPDLAEVAAYLGMDEAEVVRRHAAGEYRVACTGFAPGFAFLVGLPPELAVPRRATPRVMVPAGSVGIGGEQTGVYPLPTPGGWNLIGRTDRRLFDLARPEPFLLRTGDRVRFRPTEQPTKQGRWPETEGAEAAVSPGPTGADPAAPALLVVEPGLLTTVQDLGRPGLMRWGVAPGGALDRRALTLGNRLLGNEDGAAALEITLRGPRLRFERPAVAAVTGAELGARLNGATLPRWTPVAVGRGDELAWEPAAGGRGARAYLCLAGGIAVEPVMGSRSTDLFAGFGGYHGRPLAAGDGLALGQPALPVGTIVRRRLDGAPPDDDPTAPVRVVLGPQAERFTAEGIAAFLGGEYRVSGKADRTGLRLSGPPVVLAAGADLVSEGIAHGAVQVPGDEQPILLLAARQTVGGYPKIATVIGADLDRLGQRRPGDALRFAAVEVAAARELTLAARAELEQPVVETGRPTTGWSPPGAGEASETARSWTPEAVATLAAELRAAGVSSLRLDIAAVGLALDLRFGGTTPPLAPPTTDPAPEETADRPTVVTAPLLGVFYRRPAPDAPPFAEPGQAVAAGDRLGMIEVMKSYHEVTTPRTGVVAEFLVEDGAFVEFGQGLVTLI